MVESDPTLGAPQAGFIEQDFDHFGDSQRDQGKKWKQHFYSLSTQNDSLPPTEINFLMLEGEGGFSVSWISDNWAFVQWAKAYGATAYTLEHRFYGNSDSELVNDSVDLERLKLLTSQQALADAAVFIKNINREKNFTNPMWITLGGSYPGNLAAWMRLKYPDLVEGAIASSAPVFAKTNFKEYLQVVDNSYKLYGSEGCAEAIVDFFGRAQQLIKTAEGRRQLRICEPANGELANYDAQLFMSGHLGSLSETVQYDDSSHYKMNKTCNYYKGWITWLDQLKQNSSLSAGSCTSYSFEKDMASFNDTKSLTYYWYWQTCNEFGYFQTSERNTSSYSIHQDALTPDFFVEMCKQIFGKQFDRAYTDSMVDYTNQVFGGLDTYHVTNIKHSIFFLILLIEQEKYVFLNGSEDPWHKLSVLSDVNQHVRSYLIEGTSHCYDMYAVNSFSMQGHVDAHEIAKSELKKWLS
uniref:Serine carboxypeptidase S28 n=1 Tax=Ditylenchus dipsaci TaxID=166011 RepID=A0A915CUA3_9BILA